ncbi:MAG TPA: dihydroorotate dehydrogenase electron transfer subunit [Candidatus Hydrogenedentes bacterium]|nr:dihydroorotate dehydrogenase electron transfer subunit [Candidatus Hydrogenedentota bacterium]HOV76034.1 dihydroorotate dehydrogenase electron transfer subunit [Candidatus Hydrogenedentota bacterium]
MPHVEQCPIVMHQEVAPGHFRMAVRSPAIAGEARAGQFAMLQVAEGIYPFLRRPMSFERIFSDGVAFLFKVEGEGTRLLARRMVGQTVGVQGPLGKPFPIETRFARHILVAGGIGVAPFPALAEALVRGCGKAPEAILAARTRDMLLCEADLRQIGCTVHVATDDGSAGVRALAHELLDRFAPDVNTRVYACGPMPMMKAVSQVAMQAGADCQVSLEAQMACGDGACLGCVVESRQESEGEKMLRVCADGPVFDTTVIDWDAHDLAYDR